MPSVEDVRAFIKSNTNVEIDIAFEDNDAVCITIFDSAGVGFSFGIHAGITTSQDIKLFLTKESHLEGYEDMSFEQRQKINQALRMMAEARKLISEV